MAHRVAVMRHGILQQVGTPTEVYDTPANEFTALLIGQPAMSLFECAPVTEAGCNYLTINGSATRMAAPADVWAKVTGKNLGTIKVSSPSALRWTSEGESFAITSSRGELLSSEGHKGSASLPPGTYADFEVQADSNWTLSITPGG